MRPHALTACALILLSSIAALLTGCGSFFQCEGKADCPTTTCVQSSTVTCPTTPPTTTTDYVYVSNSASGPTYLNGYTLASGTLTAATNSPFSLGNNAVPSALAVTPANTFLYFATDSNFTNPIGNGNIYGYSITTGGALSILAAGSPLLQENDAALAISPDGQWLFTLPIVGQLINEYPINTSTGLLGQLSAYYGLSGAPNGLILPLSIAVAPTGQYFAVALGTAGADVYSFDTTNGQGAAAPVTIIPANASTGIYSVAFDSNNNLYCAATDGLEVFSISSAGAVTPLMTYPTGHGARSIVINKTSTDIYVGNQTDGTITGYAIGTNAALTALVGSPYTAPTDVGALAIDNTSAYLIAAGYNTTSGIQLFSIGSAGALTPGSTAGSGAQAGIPLAIAATH
jgi:6-phosphogluconolactonase (cycloisomerase 2 family)